MDEHSAAGSVRAEVGRALALPRRRLVAVGDARCRANAGAATAAATASTCVSGIVSRLLSKICPTSRLRRPPAHRRASWEVSVRGHDSCDRQQLRRIIPPPDVGPRLEYGLTEDDIWTQL